MDWFNDLFIEEAKAALGRPAGNSSGSGSADWSVNDPKAPGYVKNRPFYEGEPVKGVIVAETAVNLTESPNAQNPFSFAPVAGEKYNVTWNGVEYECEAVEVEQGNMKMILLGNLSSLGMTDTGEPFTIGYYPAYDMSMVMGEQGSTHTVSIEGYKREVTTIPVKYLPMSLVNAYISGPDKTNITCDTSYNDILEALKSGVNVQMKVTNNYNGSMSGYLLPMIRPGWDIRFYGLVPHYGDPYHDYFEVIIKADGSVSYEHAYAEMYCLKTDEVWMTRKYGESSTYPRIVMEAYTDEAGNYECQSMELCDDMKSFKFSGDGVVIRSNYKYYRIGVDSSGNVTATEVTG